MLPMLRGFLAYHYHGWFAQCSVCEAFCVFQSWLYCIFSFITSSFLLYHFQFEIQHAELAAEFERRMKGELPADENWVDRLPGNPAVSTILLLKA